MGIAIPMLVPPLIAAFIALLLAPEQAPALAYIAGTMGCWVRPAIKGRGESGIRPAARPQWAITRIAPTEEEAGN